MGECVFYLKASFKTYQEAESACKGLNKFLKQNWKACQELNQAITKKKFPLIHEYLQLTEQEETQDYAFDDALEAYTNSQTEVHYAANVGHLGTWEFLQTYIEKKFKPIKVIWGSEEDGYNMDSLNFYAYKDIVEGILQHKELLPLLLSIHEDLDQLVALRLNKE